MQPKLSVILPTFNEAQNDALKTVIKYLDWTRELEIIFVDGGSTDGTKEFLLDLSLKHSEKVVFVSYPHHSRAEQMNKGLRKARASMILFHHPKSFLTSTGINALIDRSQECIWGSFSHQFDKQNIILDFSSWYSNRVRGDYQQVYDLDHCIFASRKKLEQIGGVPPSDIFEDTELCYSLRKIQKGERLPYLSTASSIQFQQSGIIRQTLKYLLLKILYNCKCPYYFLNKLYS